MVELHETATAINYVFWVVMFCVATVILVQVSNYLTGESPQTVFKAARATLIVWATVYFVYDLSGYLFARIMQDPSNGIHMPAHYTYWDWFREPFAVKWYVLGFVPIIRYMPVIFGLFAGSLLHVFILDVTYPIALAVFLAQLFLNAFALIAISFAFNLGFAAYVRDVVRPELVAEQQKEVREALASHDAPRNLRQLGHRIGHLDPQQDTGWRQVEAGWRGFNAVFNPVYSWLRPVTKHLPLPAQDFLDSGGWLLVLPALVGVVIAWPRIHRGRKHLHHRRRKRRGSPDTSQWVRLSEIGDSITGLGERQITVQSQPGRLRLVVFAPAGPTGALPPIGADGPLLEAILPGLGQVAGTDFPKIVRWADGPAREDFHSAVLERVRFPKADASRWVLLVGDSTGPKGSYRSAVCVLTAEPTAARVLEVPSGRWADFVGVREVPVEERDI
jgi:hypothetical protein